MTNSVLAGEQHAPLWVCVTTLDLRSGANNSSVRALSMSAFPPLGTKTAPSPEPAAAPLRPKRFRSTRKAKKLEAQQESAMRAIESTYWQEAFLQEEEGKGPKPEFTMVQVADDPVVILDRLLLTIEQVHCFLFWCNE